MKILSCFVVAFGLLGIAVFSRADDKQKTPAQPAQKAQGQDHTNSMEAYLGVGVEAVPAAMRSHMTNALPEGQGVLVDQVAKDSPAGKAGLQPHDILLSIGDKKLTSPEELVKAVRDAKAGQEVAVGYLRGGKSSTCKITLGERSAADSSSHPQVYRFRPDEQFQGFFEEHERMNGEHGWNTFDSMKLSRTDEHHWAAEIEYRGKDGKKEARKFSGTRDEIRKAIEADKDLPRDERSHLLRAFNFHPPVFEFQFPSFGFVTPNTQQP